MAEMSAFNTDSDVKRLEPPTFGPGIEREPKRQKGRFTLQQPLEAGISNFRETYLIMHGVSLDKINMINAIFEDTDTIPLIVPYHIRKNSENGLPLSLIRIPDGYKKGKYVLLKGIKNTIKDLGKGGENRVTLLLNWETGETDSALRSAWRENFRPNEMEANETFSQYSDHFATGRPIKYTGLRNNIDGQPFTHGKAGYLMDNMDGKDLWEELIKKESYEIKVYHTDQEKMNIYQKRIATALKIAESLKIMHDLGYVHRDLKLENIMIKNGSPLIGDFGFTEKEGVIAFPAGTIGSMAPEEYQAYKAHARITVDRVADIWGYGYILADLVTAGMWNHNYGRHAFYYDNPDKFVEVREQMLSGKNDPFEDIIRGCLQINPADRLTIDQIIDKLRSALDGAGVQ